VHIPRIKQEDGGYEDAEEEERLQVDEDGGYDMEEKFYGAYRVVVRDTWAAHVVPTIAS
jgi:hypothetical protein